MANERRAQREKNVEVFLGRVFVISGVYCLSCPWAFVPLLAVVSSVLCTYAE